MPALRGTRVTCRSLWADVRPARRRLGMLSAAGDPIVLYGPPELPPILLHDAVPQTMHRVLALLLFATFLAHFAAALTHALIYRDGVSPRMASWKERTGNLPTTTRPAATT
jgi:hypothetical protein